MDTVQEEKGGANGESSMETYTLRHVKQTASGNLLYDSENSQRGSVTTQRGGKGRQEAGRYHREGKYVYLWLIHVDVWQKPTQYYKPIILQLKIFFKKLKEKIVVHIYNRLLNYKKNAFESALMSWMNLEPIAHSELSQKEKDNSSILMRIYGIQKDGRDEPVCRAAKQTQT